MSSWANAAFAMVFVLREVGQQRILAPEATEVAVVAVDSVLMREFAGHEAGVARDTTGTRRTTLFQRNVPSVSESGSVVVEVTFPNCIETNEDDITEHP